MYHTYKLSIAPIFFSLLFSERNRHPSYQIAFVFVLQKLLQEAKRKLGEILSAFEFLDVQSMNLVISSDTIMKLICVAVATYKCI